MNEKTIKNAIRGVSFVMTIVILLTIPDVTLLKPLQDLKLPLTLIPIEEVIKEEKRPRPKPIPIAQAGVRSASMLAPVLAPTEMRAQPSEIVVAEPSDREPDFGFVSKLFDTPPEDRQPPKLEPNATPLPDILTTKSNEGPSHPLSALPAPVSQRGQNYQGSGNADLDVATEVTYTGPRINAPASDVPATGLSRGDVVSTSPTPGSARGEKYTSNVGTSTGSAPSTGLSGPGEDVVGEGELSGLLNWLRNQKAAFPPVVQSYMETKDRDLKGLASHGGWDIFIQFSEVEHQLKIFLTRGGTGILLADSDFKSRSQLFGLGNVSREGGQVSAIAATRDKPTLTKTDEFYRVFHNWMESIGINLGSRTAK